MKSHICLVLLCAVVGCAWAPSRASETAVAAGEQSAAPETISVTDAVLRPWGVRPLLGRDFIPQDFRKATPEAAMISAELFASDFGSRATIIGHKIRLVDHELIIVGVAPRQPTALQGRKVWIARQG